MTSFRAHQQAGQHGAMKKWGPPAWDGPPSPGTHPKRAGRHSPHRPKVQNLQCGTPRQTRPSPTKRGAPSDPAVEGIPAGCDPDEIPRHFGVKGAPARLGGVTGNEHGKPGGGGSQNAPPSYQGLHPDYDPTYPVLAPWAGAAGPPPRRLGPLRPFARPRGGSALPLGHPGAAWGWGLWTRSGA